MERGSPPQSDPNIVVIHQEFLPSARMTAVTRSFLIEEADHIPFRFMSDRAARLSALEFHIHTQSGALDRIQQMAQNTERTLYPSGDVTLELGSRAARVLYQLQPYAEVELTKMGNRLEGLHHDYPARAGQNVIIVEVPVRFAAPQSGVDQARSTFQETMHDEFLFRHYHFKPTQLAINRPQLKKTSEG